MEISRGFKISVFLMFIHNIAILSALVFNIIKYKFSFHPIVIPAYLLLHIVGIILSLKILNSSLVAVKITIIFSLLMVINHIITLQSKGLDEIISPFLICLYLIIIYHSAIFWKNNSRHSISNA